MSEFVIETNVTIPPRNKAVYPWATMEVGDSFLVANYDLWSSVKSAAYLYSKRNGVKFTIRKLREGLRIWRVE